MKAKINKYAVYNKEGELIDILELNKKQYKEYVANNPEYSVQDLLDDGILEYNNDFTEDFFTWEVSGFDY
jgi:hypothetical protein